MYAVSEIDHDSPNRIKNASSVSESNPSQTNATVTNAGALSDFTGINPANEEANTSVNLTPLITDSSVKKDSKKSVSPTQKSSETTKNVAKGENAPVASTQPIIIQDDEEGNVKIYQDKIETDEVIVEANRMIFKKPGATVVKPFDPKVFQQLTPAQRRKLLRLRQMQKNLPKPPPPPVTHSTPKN
jgi:hypothetical protein